MDEMHGYDAATVIRTFLRWYEKTYEPVPEGMYEELELFVDDAQKWPEKIEWDEEYYPHRLLES